MGLQHWPEGGTCWRELSLPNPFNPTSIITMSFCITACLGAGVSRASTVQLRGSPVLQVRVPTGQGRMRQYPASLSWSIEGMICSRRLEVLDLLPFPAARCKTVWRGRGYSHSSHVLLPLAPATLVPGCTARRCWARGSMAPQFPPPCSSRNSPRAEKANPALLGRGPSSED